MMKRKNIEKCRVLRKRQTDAEKKLWGILRDRQLTGAKFRRQFPIENYILDFYSPEYRIGIEADGGQHFEEAGKQRDKKRERYLSILGIKILRFSDLDILNNIEGVWKAIQEKLSKTEKPPQPAPSPPRVEGNKREDNN